jgi:hypothetical protein
MAPALTMVAAAARRAATRMVHGVCLLHLLSRPVQLPRVGPLLHQVAQRHAALHEEVQVQEPVRALRRIVGRARTQPSVHSSFYNRFSHADRVQLAASRRASFQPAELAEPLTPWDAARHDNCPIAAGALRYRRWRFFHNAQNPHVTNLFNNAVYGELDRSLSDQGLAELAGKFDLVVITQVLNGSRRRRARLASSQGSQVMAMAACR